MSSKSRHGRTHASLLHQYDVERDLAARLRGSDRRGRTELFKTLYAELFERVPDHGRLKRRETQERSERSVRTQLNLLRDYLGPDKVMLEFAPGDCRLSFAAAPRVGKVVGADISDQRSPTDVAPANFEHLVYDGYDLPVADGSVDVAFSYQFLEHLHPEDVELHFSLVARVLRPGGVYVFDTPHRYSGPHDVAGFFGHALVCLHMQEWTYRELRQVAAKQGFERCFAYRRARPMQSRWSNAVNDGLESMLGLLPPQICRKLSRRVFQSVALACVKPSSSLDG